MAAEGQLHAEPAGSVAPSVPTGAAPESPVTVVATHYVKPGCGAAFEALIDDTFVQSRAVVGDASVAIVRPSQPSSNTYTIIINFDRNSDYRRWLDLPQRTVFVDRLEQIVNGPPEPQLLSGMEVWVTPPGQATSGAPDLYKTVAVNFLALYPTYMISSVMLGPALAAYPLYMTAAVRSGLSIALASAGVIQLVAYTFRGWLFPPPEACRAGSDGKSNG